MDLKDLNEMGKELEISLRMQRHPVAVKFLKNKTEIPDEAIIPTRDWKHKIALCQAISRAEDGHEQTIAMFKEDNWCFEPVIGLGLVKKIPEFLEGYHRYPDSVKTLEAGAKWCQNMPSFEKGRYQGIVVGPLNKCNFMPDLIIMHVNGLALTYLMVLKNCMDGEDITCQLSGHAACVYALVPPMKLQQCYIAIPCKGDRDVARAQDSDLIFSMPTKLLPEFIDCMQYEQKHEWGLPLHYKIMEEYPLKPKYRDFGQKLGLDMKQSLPREQKYEKY
jgi:uncharacterized protein (DUF169 family)